MERPNKIFLLTILLSVVLVIWGTWYRFSIVKAYDFMTEAPCDPQKQTCFYRDCSEPDNCPPNGLENYRVFHLSAADFKKCINDSCLVECTIGTLSCTETKCGESEEDVCTE